MSTLICVVCHKDWDLHFDNIEAEQRGCRSERKDMTTRYAQYVKSNENKTESWTFGGSKITTHSRENCQGQHCTIHNPSEKAEAIGPQSWRWDRWIMERICEHGIGHPDPDEVEFWEATEGPAKAEARSIHGCDGCCS